MFTSLQGQPDCKGEGAGYTWAAPHLKSSRGFSNSCTLHLILTDSVSSGNAVSMAST